MLEPLVILCRTYRFLEDTLLSESASSQASQDVSEQATMVKENKFSWKSL